MLSLQQLSAPVLPAESLSEYDLAVRAAKVIRRTRVGVTLVTMSTYDQRGIVSSVADARNIATETLTDESGRLREVVCLR